MLQAAPSGGDEPKCASLLLSEAILPVAQLWVPVLAAPFGCRVQERPQCRHVGCVVRILAGVCGLLAAFAAPEVADGAVLAIEDVVGRHVRVLGAHISAREFAA